MGYEEIMAKARANVAEMDAIDCKSVGSMPLSIALGTVSTALESAIRLQDWNVAAEAQVMLESVMEKNPSPKGKT
jgi:hypothetical protein